MILTEDIVNGYSPIVVLDINPPDGPVPLEGERDGAVDGAAEEHVPQRVERVRVQRVEHGVPAGERPAVRLQEGEEEEAVVEDHEAGQGPISRIY